jgi:ABC-type transport system substrate-binding protein
MKRSISRRQFLTLAAAGALAAACSPAQPPAATPPQRQDAEPATSTAAPASTATPAPTNTPAPATAAPTSAPTVAPVAAGRPEIIKFYPDIPSQVIQTHHAGVWQGDQLSPEALRQMLDASITKLTGLADAKSAWAALFNPLTTASFGRMSC